MTTAYPLAGDDSLPQIRGPGDGDILAMLDLLIEAVSLQTYDVKAVGTRAWQSGNPELAEWARDRLSELESIGVQLQLLRAKWLAGREDDDGSQSDADGWRDAAERSDVPGVPGTNETVRLSLRPKTRRKKRRRRWTPDPWWLRNVRPPKEWEGRWYYSTMAEADRTGVQTGLCPHCRHCVRIDFHSREGRDQDLCDCGHGCPGALEIHSDLVWGDSVITVCPECGKHSFCMLESEVEAEAGCPECRKRVHSRFYKYDSRAEDFVASERPRWYVVDPD